MIANRWGPFTIVEKLGQGGMGSVFKAFDNQLDRIVALKRLDDRHWRTPGSEARLRREARVVACLRHPRIVAIHSLEWVDGEPGLVMEYVEGQTLNELIPPGGMEIVRAIELARQLVEVLTFAAEAGVIHRDLKPTNIMVTAGDQIKVLDFGLAKVMEHSDGIGPSSSDLDSTVVLPPLPEFTYEGIFAGTPQYMSPEQAEGRATDWRTDVFSAGAVMFEMFTGERAFSGATRVQVVASVIRDQPPPPSHRNPAVPTEIDALIMRCLEKKPTQRFDTPAEFVEHAGRAFSVPQRTKSAPARRARRTPIVSTKRGRVSPIRKVLWWLLAVVLLAIIACPVYFWTSYRRPKVSEHIKSIAVLPFKTIGSSGEDAFLGIGMADIIITRLGKTRRVLVSPTEAVRRYSEKGFAPLAIGRALHMESVLTGEVQQYGRRLRVTAQLLRSSDGRSLWADEFDEKIEDIFAVQDSISQRLIGPLMLNLSDAEEKPLTEKYTTNIEAYQLYLKGRYYWAKRKPESVRKAIECFTQAVRLDPKYALAYAGLADAYAVTVSGLPASERMLKAKSAAERALAIDNSSAEAYTSLAFILYKFEWNWSQAENYFRRAIQLNPSYALAHHWFGEFLILRGQFDAGFAEIRQAQRLDPLSLPIANDIARGLYRARRYDEAIVQSRRALELDPDYRNAYATLVYAYEQKREYAECVAADLEVLRIENTPREKLAQLQKAFAVSGWKGYWRGELNLMKERARRVWVPAYVFAEIYIRLDERDLAIQQLEKSYEEHGDVPLNIGVEPLLDGLRSDPRFANLLRRSGVAESAIVRPSETSKPSPRG